MHAWMPGERHPSPNSCFAEADGASNPSGFRLPPMMCCQNCCDAGQNKGKRRGKRSSRAGAPGGVEAAFAATLTLAPASQAAVTERGVKAELMNDENSEGGGVMLLGQEQVKGGLVASRGAGLSKTPIAGSARAGREPSVRLAQRQAKREVQSCSSADEVVPGPERHEDVKRKRRDGGGRDSQGFGLAAKRQQHGRDSARLGGDAHAKSREGSSVSSGSSDHEKGHDKYCHFCQHAKKNMLPCESEGCTHIYCLYCLSVHLGDDTDPTTSSAWKSGAWHCPTCRGGCCCSKVKCTRAHRHCKAFRYRCRRADAALKRSTAAHALVCLSSSNDEESAASATAAGAGRQGGGGARAGGIAKKNAGGARGGHGASKVGQRGGGGQQSKSRGTTAAAAESFGRRCDENEGAEDEEEGEEGRGAEAVEEEEEEEGEGGKVRTGAHAWRDGVANLIAAGLMKETGGERGGEREREGEEAGADDVREEGGGEDDGGCEGKAEGANEGEETKGEGSEGSQAQAGSPAPVASSPGEDLALEALASLSSMTSRALFDACHAGDKEPVGASSDHSRRLTPEAAEACGRG